MLKYIGHTVDRYAKYHVLFPLRSKEAAEVVPSLKRYVFSVFCLPYQLQSDNGTEFVNSSIYETLKNARLSMDREENLGYKVVLKGTTHALKK